MLANDIVRRRIGRAARLDMLLMISVPIADTVVFIATLAESEGLAHGDRGAGIEIR